MPPGNYAMYRRPVRVRLRESPADRTARRPARHHAVPVGGGVDRGNDYREHRIAARRLAIVASCGERRSPPDGGTAARGPELDGAVAAGQRHHVEQRRPASGRGRRQRVSAEPRRPADHEQSGALGIRTAEVQPGSRSRSSRSSRTCSTSRKADRPGSRCRPSRSPAATSWSGRFVRLLSRRQAEQR